MVESTDIVHGFSARHLVCWGWGGFRKLRAAADNSPPTGCSLESLGAVQAPSRHTPH
ncbi:hypothetical protein OHB41_46775 [Streptomyces sp. NBC_01571]|uniref:hypothetical protein n=1 Tax=Streptomyces sp. NBC_01571 TaxID=2975883 RepID=UPI0022500870|nr:hypothetical protein [Streptomyces sp. NBC_01571]MCX4580532.1 hypothetical protein [Streptomyces sp. NBC_01571]